MTAEPREIGAESVERRLLARDAGLAERIRVYRRGESLEIDTSSFYRITRHRVLFEEVVLATLHRGRSWRSVLGLALVGLCLGSVVSVLAESNGGETALWIFGPPLLFSIIGYLIPDWVLSIQSRRTWTRMRFGARRAKARRVFDELVAAIRETQGRLAAERPAAPVARSPFAPPPAGELERPERPFDEPILPPPGAPAELVEPVEPMV